MKIYMFMNPAPFAGTPGACIEPSSLIQMVAVALTRFQLFPALISHLLFFLLPSRCLPLLPWVFQSSAPQSTLTGPDYSVRSHSFALAFLPFLNTPSIAVLIPRMVYLSHCFCCFIRIFSKQLLMRDSHPRLN
jgi:hypothetical protein